MFEMLNNYSCLFFIAFWKAEWMGCYGFTEFGIAEIDDHNSCFSELTFQMLSIFVLPIFKNLFEVIFQMIRIKLKEIKSKKTAAAIYSLPEDQQLLAIVLCFFELTYIDQVCKNHELDIREESIDCTYNDYIELVIQYGFIIMFSISFPLAPLLAVINNIIVIQKSKLFFIKRYRRLAPRDANSLGVW